MPTACLSCSFKDEAKGAVAVVEAVLRAKGYEIDKQEQILQEKDAWAQAFLKKAMEAKLLVSLFTNSSPSVLYEAGLYKPLLAAQDGKKHLVLILQTLPEDLKAFVHQIAGIPCYFTDIEELANRLPDVVPALADAIADHFAATTGSPSRNYSVLKSEVICTIASDGHSRVRYHHTVKGVHETDSREEIAIEIAIGASAPRFKDKKGIDELRVLLANNTIGGAPRDKQSLAWRILKGRPNETYSLVNDTPERNAYWKKRRFNLRLPAPLKPDEILEYSYTWCTPRAFATSGDEFFEHTPTHGVDHLDITLRFEMPLGDNPADPWEEAFEKGKGPHLKDEGLVLDQVNKDVILNRLHNRVYHWHFKHIPAGRMVRIEWTLKAPAKPAGKPRAKKKKK